MLGCALVLVVSGLTLGPTSAPATATPSAAKPRAGHHHQATPWRPVEGGFFNNPWGGRRSKFRIERQIVEAIRHARPGSHIRIAVYSFDRVNVAKALIEAHRRGVAVIFCTGDCPEGGRAFAHGCLAKPYRPADLLAAIDAVDGQLQGRARPRRLPRGFALFEQPVAA